MKPRGRRPLSSKAKESERSKILRAAKTLFVEQGYQSVSMRALAKATDMSPTSLYRFFNNKRAILINIWHDVFSQMFARCRAASARADDPAKALIVYGECFVEYWVENPENYLMVYGEIDTPTSGESFFADSELVNEQLSYLAILLAQTGVAESKIELTLQQLICILHGVCHSLITIPELNWQSPGTITAGLIEKLLEVK